MELGMSRVRLSQYMKTSPKITAKTVRCSINSAQPRIKKDLDHSKKLMDGPIKICQKDLSYISNSGKIVKGFDQGVIL